MNEEQIRAIVKDELQKNYRFGSPKVPLHVHDGVSNEAISSTNLKDFIALPTINKNQLVNSQYSFENIGNTPFTIIFGGTGGFPDIKGNEGNMALFWDGTAIGSSLNFFIDGDWHGINFDF